MKEILICRALYPDEGCVCEKVQKGPCINLSYLLHICEDDLLLAIEVERRRVLLQKNDYDIQSIRRRLNEIRTGRR